MFHSIHITSGVSVRSLLELYSNDIRPCPSSKLDEFHNRSDDIIGQSSVFFTSSPLVASGF